MTWIILVAFLLILLLMSLAGRPEVLWANKLRRVNAGVTHKSEWMAPDDVIQAVHDDYLASMRWLPESMLLDWSHQWEDAPHYLSGLCLKRHQELLKYYLTGRFSPFIGIMRCIHHVEVRNFSQDGERCLILDRQTSRRMATYDYWTQTRLSTQDIGDGVVVCEMRYDSKERRWKIDRYIQELPLYWKNLSRSRVYLSHSLSPIGRDN